MPFVATKIDLSETIESILEKYSKSRTLPANQIQRSKIILLASQGKNNKEISGVVSVNQDTVSKWRSRWIKQANHFATIEQNNPDKLEESVNEFLKDLPRSGCPCTITEEQIIQILEIACRNPSEFGYESSHWSLTQLATVVVELNIVESISPASVSRFLKYGQYTAPPGSLLAPFIRKNRQSGGICRKNKSYMRILS